MAAWYHGLLADFTAVDKSIGRGMGRWGGGEVGRWGDDNFCLINGMV